MDEITRDMVFDIPQTLLFDILQELKKISRKLDILMKNSAGDNNPVSDKKPQGKICQYCGKVHDNPIDYANCAKAHKQKAIKEGKKEGD
jgi:hypothetical protein